MMSRCIYVGHSRFQHGWEPVYVLGLPCLDCMID